MSIANSHDLGRDLAKALNLPARTSAIDISMSAGEACIVTIKHYVGQAEADKLVEVLSRYQLLPIDEPQERTDEP